MREGIGGDMGFRPRETHELPGSLLDRVNMGTESGPRAMDRVRTMSALIVRLRMGTFPRASQKEAAQEQMTALATGILLRAPEREMRAVDRMLRLIKRSKSPEVRELGEDIRDEFAKAALGLFEAKGQEVVEEAVLQLPRRG